MQKTLLLFLIFGAFKVFSDPLKQPYVKINAQKFEFDKVKDTIFAFDGVHVIYKKKQKIEELFCDKMIYNKQEKKIYAIGNVFLKGSDGACNRSSSLEITDDFEKGIVESIHVTTKDDARFLAKRVEKENGVETFLDGSYTACKTCDKESAFWQFSAAEIVHDSNEHRVKYYHATFSILGVPVFYTPYFSHYDATIKRKSGFVFPQIGFSNEEGFYLGPSYYYVVDNFSDLTVTPVLFSKDSPIGIASYRKNLKRGALKASASIHSTNNSIARVAPSSTPSNTESPIDKTRWSIFSKLGYDLDQKQRVQAKVSRASDTTYFMKYPVLSRLLPAEDNDLISYILYERFQKNYYLSAKTIAYQTALPKTTPFVLPNIFFEKFSQKPILGGTIGFIFNMDYLKRTWGVPGLFAQDTSRFYTKILWNKHFQKNNHVFVLKAEANIVLEWLKNYKESTTPLKVKDPTLYQEQIQNSFLKKRFLPLSSIEWSYPLVHKLTGYSWIVEPKTLLTLSPYSDNTHFPNDDSRTLTLDNTTLFLNNRFDGYDRFDSGIRFVYGVNQKVYFSHHTSFEWFIGQSKRLDSKQIFPTPDYGEDNKFSDIVNSIKIIPYDFIKLRFRNAIDHKTKQQRFMEVGICAGKPIALFDFAYVRLSDKVFMTQYMDQLNWQASSKINDQWSCSYAEVRDFAKMSSGPLKQYGSIVWQNDCFKISTGIFKSNISNNDLKPFSGFLIELSFKTLGAYAPIRTEQYASSILSHF
ncbi:MAG: LPS-assembly protein LptD [Holosporales bacterium]